MVSRLFVLFFVFQLCVCLSFVCSFVCFFTFLSLNVLLSVVRVYVHLSLDFPLISRTMWAAISEAPKRWRKIFKVCLTGIIIIIININYYYY